MQSLAAELEPLEGRVLLAGVSVGSNNELGLAGQGTDDNLTISVANGVYTITDANNPFVLLFNAGTAILNGFGTQTLTASGISAIRVDVGDGNDTVNVLSSGVPTELDMGNGSNDVANIGSTAPDSGGVLSGINALVTVKDPDTATLNVDDSGDPTGRFIAVSDISSHVALDFGTGPIITVGSNFGNTNLYAGMGDDTLNGVALLGTPLNFFGGGGDDSIRYQPAFIQAVDTFDGGAGTNTIDYSLVPASGPALNVNLQTGTAQFPANIANVQHIVGTTGDDTIIGSDAAETLEGGSGNDMIQGGGGNDTLIGDAGNDTLIGGPGDDTIQSGPGNDLSIWNDGDGSDHIDGAFGNLTQQINGSNDPTGDQFLLTADPANSANQIFSRTNLTPFALHIANVLKMQVNSLAGDDTLTLDFANGFSIPMGTPTTAGLVFDGGAGTNNQIQLLRSPGSFTSLIDAESYSQSGPNSGSINFNATYTMTFQGVDEAIDTVPVFDFLFNTPGSAGVVNLLDGLFVLGSNTAQIASGDTPSAFQPIFYANKQIADVGTGDVNTVVNNRTKADGLGVLEIDTGNQPTQVTITATPGGATTLLRLDSGQQRVNVLGPGITPQSSLSVETEFVNALTYDAGGVPTTVVAGTQAGRVTLTQPGAGPVALNGISHVTIQNNVPPPMAFTGTPATIDAVAGRALIDAAIAAFDADPLSNVSQYAASIDWGDGTPPVAGSIAQDLHIDARYALAGSHAYRSPGTYTTKVTIRDLGGSSTGFVGGVAITDERIPAAPITSDAARVVVAAAPLVAQGAVVGAIGGKDTGPVLVATFQDTGGAGPVASYAAMINWGDGTAPTAGALTSVGTSPAGTTFLVRGTHTYRNPGTYPIAVTIASVDGAATVALGSARVAKPLARVGTLTGRLDPRSDTGVSDHDGITRDNSPTFLGTAGPGAIVTLKAMPVGGILSVVGRAVADAAGNWSVSVPRVADGAYWVGASALGQDGSMAATLLGGLVIDTVAPRVTGLLIQRDSGAVVLGFRDDRSGLDGSSLINGANYAFTRANTPPGRFLVTHLTANPPSGLASLVLATINQGRSIPTGLYALAVRSGGIQDVAGNALAATFFGFLPVGQRRGGR